MELKTKIEVENGRQGLTIRREFELPVELLFTAYIEPELIEQWMGTTVVQLENKKFGCYRFETKDPSGNIHGFSGVIHELITNQSIIRTFEMENTPFPVQLEFLEFEKIDKMKSKLTMYVLYKSEEVRDQMLKLPFKQGLNMAHNRLLEVVSKLINN